MFPTVEVRWFYRGTVPLEVQAWFRRGEEEPGEPLWRVDHYLRLTDRDSLGIKLREGRIELKQRQRQYGVVHFHRRAAGVVEGWRKWSFELSEVHGSFAGMVTPAWWIAVRKGRQLRLYRFTGKSLVAGSARGFLPQGCAWELTQIDIGGELWWSVGFEAFGGETSLQETLSLLVRQAFALDGAPAFAAKDSCGYPRWLAAVVGDGGPGFALRPDHESS